MSDYEGNDIIAEKLKEIDLSLDLIAINLSDDGDRKLLATMAATIFHSVSYTTEGRNKTRESIVNDAVESARAILAEIDKP